ncbi:N-acetylglucosamine-6-phosphate deacetylase [Cryobacterium mesophilum]|uniref:N-acetylglucosamine-6-phosphate deacetylase n=1 Tax=Terrimesophilobacter mesophilus TaxID=433647 RepID=A0A4V3I9I3_9MICO|nr:N-acetylglucosamine-6-phosphate deacetylase [Terrimesophilobacter mesophilus]MBB5632822.1 N-acetylglucosamine-6-phosphate deacetylase [Terrimesophilobacter mesophilus]TFB79608.1 N-acetylglucosamine-6-phosphate deacetylase [Terrimesophilobacter mesophilus]
MSAEPVSVYTADAIVTGSLILSPGWIRVEGARILEVGRGSAPGTVPVTSAPIALRGTVVPGFVDIHAHGAAGLHFAEAVDREIEPAIDWHARRGTTTLVASLATDAFPRMEEQVAALAPLVRDGALGGIHLEGPWLSPEHRGAHEATLLHPPATDEVRRLLADPAVRMVTVAPELPGGLEAIDSIVAAGAIAAIGHTSCDFATATAAFDHGATVATHLFNGMPALHHRMPGPVGAALLDDRVVAELILDGHHLADGTVAIAARLLGDRLVAVSDSIAATGQPDGEYTLAGTAVSVRDGVARVAGGGSLAGSTMTLASAFRALVERQGFSLLEAVLATATVPAGALGLSAVGSIRAGGFADLVVLDGLTVSAVMRRGEWLGATPTR